MSDENFDIKDKALTAMSQLGHLAFGTPSELDLTPVPCYKCGKNMKSPKGVTLIGCSIEVRDTQNDPEVTAFLKLQLGDFNINERYQFCYECWIKSILFCRY